MPCCNNRETKDMVDKMEDIFHRFNPNFYRYKEIARDSDAPQVI